MSSLILASKSPRRSELLQRAGYTFTVRPAEGPETLPGRSAPEEAVQQLARRKADEVLEHNPDSVVLAADTMISLDGRTLGKPASKEDARRTLEALSGRTHEVYTGAAVFTKRRKSVFYVKTEVRFCPLDTDWIQSYLATPEPYDKAGSYAVQGQGCLFVEAVHGDFYNVMGLPVSRLSRELKLFQIVPSFTPTY
ncbi:Maf family protein [Salibacterium lacus]|uniref:dTTP/UTP pyrophosphatase n=1 Tax=Salibacterium lacus TaxID=1898109 RepID=A0ABW5T2S4_9BACI